MLPFELHLNELMLPPPRVAGLLPARAQSRIRPDIQAKIIPFTHKPVRRRDVIKTPLYIELEPIPEAEKMLHCSILKTTLDKLAYCRMKRNDITTIGLYWLFESYQWRCHLTKTRHSAKTPLTFEFKTPLFAGGTFHISNIMPRFRPGWYAGEYRMGWTPEYGKERIAA